MFLEGSSLISSISDLEIGQKQINKQGGGGTTAVAVVATTTR